MKSDVKAVRVTATGAVFAGRTRLRGLILASDGGGAGTIVLQDNSDSTTLFQGDCPNGDVFALICFVIFLYIGPFKCLKRQY